MPKCRVKKIILSLWEGGGVSLDLKIGEREEEGGGMTEMNWNPGMGEFLFCTEINTRQFGTIWGNFLNVFPL